MASQVLSGSSNPSYTNNTGQNVRVVINFMRSTNGSRVTGTSNITISWAGVSVTATGTIPSLSTGAILPSQPEAIGRGLAVTGGAQMGNNMAASQERDGSNNWYTPRTPFALPTELMLAPGQTFSAICGQYNIVVIPEAG